MAVLYDQQGNPISATHPLDVALSGTLPLASDAATQTTLASVLSKLSSDPATQTTVAAVLSKLSSDPATNTTVAAILAKQPASPALEHTTAGSPSSTRLSDGGSYLGSTAQRLHVSDGGVALKTDGSAVTQPVSVSSLPLPADAATQTTLAALLAKVSSDPATQTTLLAVLAKIPATPATEATSAAILSKLIASPATESTVAAVLAKLSSDPATQTTLAAVLSKITSDPATNTTAAAILAATQPASTALTATGAAAAAVTLTLPAAGIGLFHYIDHLEITAYSTVARTGGVTPVLVTTSNLPGGLAWSFASAAAVGSTDVKLIAATSPLKASAANTASTIVGPATASVIWRVNCVYHTGT